MKENEKLQSELAKQQSLIFINNFKEGTKTSRTGMGCDRSTQTDVDRNMVAMHGRPPLDEEKSDSKISQRRKKTSRSLSLDFNDNPQKMLTPQFEIDFKELVLEKQISEGGYGLIFRGKWRESTVAIKMLKSENMKEENIADFLRTLTCGAFTHLI